jgi:hypothetical protein
MPVNRRSRGFFTIAQNTETTDYVRLAYCLALSLKHSQKFVPYLTIGITPGTTVDKKYRWVFDNIIEIPWGDGAEHETWKLSNEWKAPWMSPYDETIKLDCDMLFFNDISLWWDYMSIQDSPVVFANKVLNWHGETITDDFYRKTFTKNTLPNIYTGFTYFTKETYTYDLYNMAKMIYWNWEKFFEEFLEWEHRPQYPSTDVVFALATKLLEDDGKSYSINDFPTFTHMKSKLQGWSDWDIPEDWTEHLKVFFTPDGVCKIGNHRQHYPLHYHVKSFITDEMISIYESLLDGRG